MSETVVTNLTDEQKSTLRYVARLIVKGSAGRKQVRGRYFMAIEGRDMKGCCAIGACLIAAGAPEENSLVLSDYLNLGYWPEINYPEGVKAWNEWNAALYSKKLINLTDVIMQLNDAAQWSFHRIAAYLRLVATKGIVTSKPA